MAKPPALLPALSPRDWDLLARRLAKAAANDVEMLTAGRLGVGRTARLSSLVTSLQQLYGLSRDEAWVASRVVAGESSALSASLMRTLQDVPDQVRYAADDAARWLTSAGLPITLSEGAVSAMVGRASAAITADWTRLAGAAQEGIVTTLQQALVGGLGARDAAAAMYQGVYGHVGLTHARALTIARTELSDAYTAANLNTYAAAGVTHYSWFAQTGSPRTCALCLSLHGSVYEIGSEPPQQHHNCRCEMLPVFDDELETVGPDGRLPGTQVPNSVIQQRVPKSWGELPADPRTLIATRDVPGWRGYKTMIRPGGVMPTQLRTAPPITSLAQYDSITNQLPDLYSDAWTNYVGRGFEDMNALARGLDIPGTVTPRYIQGTRGRVRLLQEAIDQYGDVQDDLLLYRGMATSSSKYPEIEGVWERLASLSPGDAIKDHGFLSLSAKEDVATAFAGPEFRGLDSVIEVIIPKGSKVIQGSADEWEVIAQRGSLLRFLGIVEGKLGGHTFRRLRFVLETP